MAATDYDWPTTDLTPDEVNLIREYEKLSMPLDSLAYTEAFDSLVQAAGFSLDLEGKHRAFTTLLNLRKRGRLPRILPSD